MTPFKDDLQELAWAIGIIEGEGWIGSSSKTLIPRMEVQMTDEAVLYRLRDFLGGTVYARKIRVGYKPSWTWSLARKLIVVPLLYQIQPYMCQRRQERIAHVLKLYRTRRK